MSVIRSVEELRSVIGEEIPGLNEKNTDYLDSYAETGKEYTKILKQIIEQNKLTDFDDAKILPSSEREKNLI